MARRMRATALVACALTVLAIAPGAAATSPGTPILSTWMYQQLSASGHFTQAQAVAQATSTDVIVGTPRAYTGDVPAMRSANPSLRLYVYVKGLFAAPATVAAAPEAWFEHDATGARIVNKQYGTDLMNPTAAGWTAQVAAACRAGIAAGFTGCFLDNMGPGPVLPGFDSALPVDTATGQPYSRRSWLAQDNAELTIIENALAPTPVMFNGLTNGAQFTSTQGPTSSLLPGSAGGLAETWMRLPSAPLASYPTASAWLHDVQMLQSVAADGAHCLVAVETWTTGTAAAISAWHEFSLASFLLAANGSQSYMFSPAASSSPTAPDAIASSLTLGSPVGTMVNLGGVYLRQFATGLVLVNPSTTTNQLSLGQPYRELDGTVVSSVTLPPDSSQILQS